MSQPLTYYPKATDTNTSSSAQIILLSKASHQNTRSAKDLVNMVKKHSSPFDSPDYFDSSIHDVHEHCDYEQDLNDMKQPLLPHDRTNRTPGKRAYLIGLLHSGSKKASKKPSEVKRDSSVREGTKTQVHTRTPPSKSENFHWEYDRFDGSVPDSIPELLIHLGRGRHPEILELAIDAKRRRTPDSQYNTLEYKILGAMLETIRDIRQEKALDPIQSQTLEQLGRPFDCFRFQ